MQQSRELGKSHGGSAILLHQLTQGPVPLLLIGGVHGDEPEGFYLVERFIREGAWKNLAPQASLFVLPRLNPDGCAKFERTNARGIDLNRNMPTKDWSAEARAPRYHPGPTAGSENETKILIALIEEIKPRLIISAHSWEPVVNYNGPCKKVAEVMATYNKYRAADDIGYPTPGSLGTWAGWERKIPVVTLEVERDSPEDKIWSTHAEALAAGLHYASINENMNE